MRLGNYLTIYNICRDHGNKTGFFWVNVPEVSQTGFGFQIRIGKNVYGFSIHTKQQKRLY